VRPTFPGCGREPLPQPEEDKLRSVVEQLVEMRPPIREAAKARAHANGKLEDAKKALKAAENALEAAEKAFFPIFNVKLTKAVATAKKACEICSEASEYASKRYDEESEKYLRVFEENMDVFPKKNLKRFAPPGYRF
jgi:formylmethanofuran dehydrogenase subunit E